MNHFDVKWPLILMFLMFASFLPAQNFEKGGIQREVNPIKSGPEQQKMDTLRKRVRALETINHKWGRAPFESFVESHFTLTFRKSMDEEKLFSILRTIGHVSASAGGITVKPDSSGVLMSFRGPENLDVRFALENTSPYRICMLSIETTPDLARGSENISIPPIHWNSLRERLREAADSGFSGTVLVVRRGRKILHEAYGMANRKRGIPNTTQTIFGIGSTPIDFTRAAILWLMDQGKLALSDPITQYLSNVPEDKTSMTLKHLMTGKSGLPNFHHDPEEDENYDLSWINRNEAVQRILNASLLFPPGKGKSHSHSAFTLLAAIVEKVSGQSYQHFLQDHFFDPMKMNHTGFYGKTSGFEPDQMAVGYGTKKIGDPNIPLNWGPTSWLVMGSGGMVSNPGDMYRWVKNIHSGRYISKKALKIYGRGGVLSGGSDRGFLFVYVDNPRNAVFLSSNAHKHSGDLPSSLAKALAKLVKK